MPRRSRSRVSLSVLTAAGLILGAPGFAAGQESPPLTGDFAHQFQLASTPTAAPDTGFTDDAGRNVSLASFGGRVVLLNFWATWCAPCVEEMPTLNRLQARLGGEGLSVVAVSVDEGGRDVVAPFLERYDLGNLEAYTDPKSELLGSFGVGALPTSFLIDGEGKIAGAFAGATKWDSDDAVGLVRHYLDRRGDPSESFYALAQTDDTESDSQPSTAAEAYAQGDYAAAYRLWRPAADAGDAEAQFNIAVLFDLGLGFAVDKARAAVWYAHSAEGGYADASYNLGIMFLEGDGIPEDYGLAYLLFDLAADRDPAAAEPRDALAAAMGPGRLDQAEDLVLRVRADETGEVLSQTLAAVLGETLADALPAPPAPDLIRRIQEGLARHGYDPGGTDGVIGPKTRAAVRAFQVDAGLTADGEVSEELLTQLENVGE